MPLPPHDDPLRPLYAAARSAQGLGIVFLVLGVWATISLFFSEDKMGVYSERMFLIVVAIGLTVYFGTGLGLTLTVGAIRRGRMWAIITNLGIAGLWMFLVSIVLFTTFTRSSGYQWNTWLSVAVYIAGGVAFARLAWLLIRGLRSLRKAGVKSLGFEPVLSQPALLVDPAKDKP